ncbi:FG-GAP repeat protein [Candidatus Sumerlaeota bacterium]|nr:FG-GAP repeat protein [Candidatus Sumerlaeota bacterium]
MDKCDRVNRAFWERSSTMPLSREGHDSRRSLTVLNPGNPVVNDYFGWVAISGNLVAVGARGDDPGGVADAGRAAVSP